MDFKGEKRILLSSPVFGLLHFTAIVLVAGD
jgi:hypothetical protein